MLGSLARIGCPETAAQSMVFLRCDRNKLRATHLSVASHERHSMDEAGGSDDLVGRIAVKIQRFDRAADIERQRPCLNACQRPSQFRMVQVELDAALFREFGNFPENDGGDALGFIREQSAFTKRQVVG